MRCRSLISIAIWLLSACGSAPDGPFVPERDASGRWTVASAKRWYEEQPWLVGANFVPSTAVNELEMWQADTFDPETIDRELGMAEGLGFNVVRVFLHNLLWEQDPEGFTQRIDQYLHPFAPRELHRRHKVAVARHQNDCVDLLLEGHAGDVQPDPHIHSLLAKLDAHVAFLNISPRREDLPELK